MVYVRRSDCSTSYIWNHSTCYSLLCIQTNTDANGIYANASVDTSADGSADGADGTTIQQGGDSRYDRAPQPLRDWIGRPELPPIGALPINIPTQGFPESFQSVGVIQAGDQILPLYGRRTLRGSDRWNYYTRTDTYNPVPLPVHFQRRDCMDDVGCQEILSGETVKIDALHKEGKTNIYRFDGPKYIPGLL